MKFTFASALVFTAVATLALLPASTEAVGLQTNASSQQSLRQYLHRGSIVHEKDRKHDAIKPLGDLTELTYSLSQAKESEKSDEKDKKVKEKSDDDSS